LEEAESTDGQGRALSAHRSKAYGLRQADFRTCPPGDPQAPRSSAYGRAGNRISEWRAVLVSE